MTRNPIVLPPQKRPLFLPILRAHLIFLIHTLLFLFPFRVPLQIRTFDTETQHKAYKGYTSEQAERQRFTFGLDFCRS